MTTTSIRDFVKAVKAVMETMLDGFELEEKDIVKMNDIINHGLIARRRGENAGATVYLDEAFSRGEDIDSVARDLAGIVLEADSHKPVTADSNFDFSFDSIKDKLTLRLLDIERNTAYLMEHPCREIGAGLAVVAEINVGDEYSIVVNNDIARDYDLDVLFDTATANMTALYPAQMISLESAIFGNGRNVLDSNDEDIDGMYTLMSDGLHCFGASTLAYKGVAEKVRRLFGSGYFILPSSLHEVILLKDDGTARASDLKAMVTEANHTVVAPYEVLSDSVFYYDGEIRRVA